MPTPLTLSDLESWTFSGTALAVLGHPIGHSLSPVMQNAALTRLAADDSRFADWRYFRFDVPPEDLPLALDRLHARGFRGLNLTVPHKIVALDHVVEIDAEARAAGAVNTLSRFGKGWRGSSTDGYGLAAAIGESLGFPIAGSPILLIGAGGAARSAAAECLRRGCASLWIANRSRDNLDALLAQLSVSFTGIPVRGVSAGNMPEEFPAGSIVINATSLGLHPEDKPPVDLSALPTPRAVFDMIYNPPQTALLRQAAALDLPATNGLSMLVHQGAKSLEIWTGVPAVETAPVMAAALRAH